MFNLGYYKILNKRRIFIRGKKKRYSVHRAEENILKESNYKIICKKWCEKLGVDIQDYKIEHPKLPWNMTLEYLKILTESFPYTFSRHVLNIYSDEELQILRDNVKIAEEYRKTQKQKDFSQNSKKLSEID